MLYVFYITTTPYLPCNNKNINRKELYDFYYTAITLTMGYKAGIKQVYRAFLQHACNIKFAVLMSCLIRENHEHLYPQNIPAAIRYLVQ